jgi:hypothetical protein
MIDYFNHGHCCQFENLLIDCDNGCCANQVAKVQEKDFHVIHDLQISLFLFFFNAFGLFLVVDSFDG